MAGRREKLRRVGIIPEYRGFTPDGLASGDAIDMTVDELEVLRLCDLEGLNQEAVAQQMGIARATVAAISSRAHRKVANALVNGRAIVIEGGNIAYSPITTTTAAWPAKEIGTMRVATTYDNGNIFMHFGRSEQFKIYDIQDGKIRYDGININKIKKADLRHSLGMVLQDTHLFTASVKDNIRYGKLDATDEEVIEAAKLANADLFVKHLPDGYQTMLTGDGANLSQGQRQLLAIARATVANPPALILDEATSSIDSRTEKLVQDGMDKLMHGRTTLVIAHRLSTIKNSDCIMVLEQGHIIERGNHQSLIKEKGKYYQLYTGAIEMD